jgi:hypothetical protein
MFAKEVLDTATIFEAYNLLSGVLLNEGKGKYNFIPFSPEAQNSPGIFNALR